MSNKNSLILIGGKARSGKDTSARQIKNILKKNGINSEIIAFADEIKSIASRLFSLNKNHLYGDEKEKPVERLSQTEHLTFHRDSIIKDGDISIDLLVHSLNDARINRLHDLGLISLVNYKKSDKKPWKLKVKIKKSLTPRLIMQDIGSSMRKIHNNVWVNNTWRIAEKILESGKTAIISDCRYKNETEVLRMASKSNYKKLGIYIKRESAPNVASHESETHDWLNGTDCFNVINNDWGKDVWFNEMYNTLNDLLQDNNMLT